MVFREYWRLPDFFVRRPIGHLILLVTAVMRHSAGVAEAVSPQGASLNLLSERDLPSGCHSSAGTKA